MPNLSVRLCRALSAAMLLIAIAVANPLRAQDNAAEPDVEAIEKIVHDYLLAHPEVILQAVERYRERLAREEELERRRTIAQYRDQLVNDPNSEVAGNPDGAVTLVEFFDYRCPYCKRVVGYMGRLTSEIPDLKIVFKEFPILGPESVLASRAAIASRKQDKYLEFHHALMALKGSFDLASILQTAAEVGIDAERLKTDMEAIEISVIIQENIALARKIGVDSTPTFVIGDRLVKGAVPYEEIKDRIDDARKES